MGKMTRNAGIVMLTVCTLFFAFVMPAGAVTIKNDIGKWQDTNGNVITAESGFLTKFNGTWWWYGREGKGKKVHSYSSTNLVDWTDEGVSATYPSGSACRPVVFYNETSGNYVMVVGIAAGTRPQMSFLTSSTPGGTFTEVNRIAQPLGFPMGDLGGFKTDDGNAYLVYNSDQTQANSTVVISRLDINTYTSLSVPTLFVQDHTNGNKREAFHVFKNPGNNMYYLMSSKTAGWNPSATMYKKSQYLYNFPKTGGNSGYNDGWNLVPTTPSSSDSFTTQHDMVVKINGTSSGYMFMYMGDRWPDYAASGVYPANGGAKAWFPLTFSSGVPTIHGEDEWTLNLSNATWSP